MKVLSSIIILLFAVNSFAQSKKDWSPYFYEMLDTSSSTITIRKVYQLDGKTSEDIYKRALLYLRTNKVDLFKSNGSKNVGWEVGMGVSKADKSHTIENFISGLGFNYEDAESKTIYGKAGFRFEGSMMGAPRLLMITSDIIIRCKEGRYQVEFGNFEYKHYNIANGKFEAIYASKNAPECGASGSLDDLGTCTHCNQRNYSEFLSDAIKSIRKDLRAFMTDSAKENNDW